MAPPTRHRPGNVLHLRTQGRTRHHPSNAESTLPASLARSVSLPSRRPARRPGGRVGQVRERGTGPRGRERTVPSDAMDLTSRTPQRELQNRSSPRTRGTHLRSQTRNRARWQSLEVSPTPCAESYRLDLWRSAAWEQREDALQAINRQTPENTGPPFRQQPQPELSGRMGGTPAVERHSYALKDPSA